MHHQHPQQQADKKANSFVIPLILIRGWATALYMPLRTRMGSDHLGLMPFVGFGIVVMWAAVLRVDWLLWLIPLDVLVLVVERIAQVRRRLLGVQEHTEYGGRPWVAGIVFRREETAKQFGEPLIVGLIGTLIYFYSSQPNAAPFFWWGGAAMAMWQGYCQMHVRKVVNQMNNAAIENDYLRSQMKRRL
jgi:hypothetical protein